MSSHASAPVTTSLLTIICVALVHRDRPDWLTIGVGDSARAAALGPERVSRLASRVARPFADVVDTFTRRGRPTRIEDPVRAELVTLRALLAVATAALAPVPLRRPAVGALLVGASLRLSTELPSLTKGAFCKALSLPERTLRHWLAHPPAHTTSAPTAPPPPPHRPPRRPRFRFDVHLPGTQVGADTTDLSVCGVPLKLVGVQDIGGRDRRLFESVVIDTRECADHVVDALRVVRHDCPGIQALTDQGTPYMAAATKLAIDEWQAEHAPQKEGDPTGKSTVEKGFGSLKDVLSPLLSLTDSLAELVPALCSADVAGAPDVREVVRYFAALLRTHFAEHRNQRTARDASRSLQQRLRQQHHEADHAERSRSANPARLSTSSPCNGSPPSDTCCLPATASALAGCAPRSTCCSAVTAAPPPTTSRQACSASSVSPASPRSETTGSTPSPHSSNANSPRPTLDTNVTLPPTRPALYRAPSGFRRARPLQTLCGI
jgi:hypothetical protein